MDKRHNASTEKIIHMPNMEISSKDLKNIQVSFKHKIPTNYETKEIDHSLDRPEDIKIYRSQGEGSRPIFERNDIIVNKDEPEDRTVSSYKRTRHSRSPKSSRNFSPNREGPTSSRRTVSFSSRNRSRSRERRPRRSRSRSRSSRRYFDRRRNSRSPRRERRSRSPRYLHRSPRRSRSRGPPTAPTNPATVIPVMFPHFYGPEEAVWFSSPLRPPMFVPPGVPMNPPRGMFRGPMPGIRPPMQGRPPYMPPRHQFRQIRPSNQSSQQ